MRNTAAVKAWRGAYPSPSASRRVKNGASMLGSMARRCDMQPSAASSEAAVRPRSPQVGEPLPGTHVHVHVTCRPTAFTVEIAAAKKRKGKGRCERVRDRPPYASVQHTSEYDRRFGGRLLHGLCGDGSCALRRGFQPLTFSSRSHADRCAAHSGAVAAACSRGCLHFLRENCINSFIS